MRVVKEFLEEDPEEHRKRVDLYGRRYKILHATHRHLDSLENTDLSLFTPMLEETEKPKHLCRLPGCSRERGWQMGRIYRKGRVTDPNKRRKRYVSIWCYAHRGQMRRKGIVGPVNEKLSKASRKGKIKHED